MVVPALAAGATAARPVIGSLWWLLKSGGGLLKNPYAQTALTLGTGAAFIPGMQESIKKGIIETPLDFETNPDAKHTLNPLQRLALGDLKGDSEDSLTKRSAKKQSLDLKKEYPVISEIEGKLNKKFDIRQDEPLTFIARYRGDLNDYNVTEKLRNAQRVRADEYGSQGAIDERNRIRRSLEREHELTLANNLRRDREFSATLARDRALELARIDQKNDSNRLLQMQLNNDQARHMYGLETQRLDSKGRKTEAVFDSLAALAGLFGI